MLAAVNWQKVISCCESTTLKTSYSFLIVHEKKICFLWINFELLYNEMRKRELKLDPELQ